jgi:glycosyltransferase involved in cell wall biosynthesis
MVVEYANYLASKGHNVVILTNVVNTVFRVRARVDKISSAHQGKMSTILRALFTRDRFDVIIADIIVMTLFLSLTKKRRVLYFAQDYDESYYKSPLMKMFIRVVYFFCLGILRIPVIAVSEELGQLLRKRFNANVTVVPNGVDKNIFYPDKDEEYLSLKGDSKVILVFARSDYRKGFDLSVKILSGFNKEIKDGIISVWAVGEDIEVPFKVRHFGFVPPENLRKILSCSDVLLYPSRHEGLPLFVLEAMACGCPVVTTEAVQFVTNHVDALKCKIEDVSTLSNYLNEVMTYEDLRKNITEGALATLKLFDINHAVNLFEKVLLKQFTCKGTT